MARIVTLPPPRPPAGGFFGGPAHQGANTPPAHGIPVIGAGAGQVYQNYGGGGGGGGGPPNGGQGGTLVGTNADGTGNYQFSDGSVWTLTTGGWQPAGGGGGGGDFGGFDPNAGGGDLPGQVAGGGATPPTITGPTDWSSVLGLAGLPADVMAGVTHIFSTVADTNVAVAEALAYVRGTPWYATTFAGINTGIQHGLFSDESGYRNYRNALDQVYHQWTGAGVDATAFQAAIGEGVDPSVVNSRFQGQAWAGANQADVQYATGAFGTVSDNIPTQGPTAGNTRFSDAQVQTLGQEQAGLGTPGGVGLKLDAAYQKAQQRMQRVFQGQVGTPQLSLTGLGQLSAPGLGKNPDIGA